MKYNTKGAQATAAYTIGSRSRSHSYYLLEGLRDSLLMSMSLFGVTLWSLALFNPLSQPISEQIANYNESAKLESITLSADSTPSPLPPELIHARQPPMLVETRPEQILKNG
jgi:hypothetical protein